MKNTADNISPISAKGNTLITVIVVTYNAAQTLQICLDSIFAQRYPAIQLVVVDGNSTDGTRELLNHNSQQIAYWVSEPDAGIYDAMNKALKQAKGSWIYFLGSDDALLPEFSDMIHELTDEHAIYYANVFSDGKKRLGELNKYQFAKFGPYHQAIIYPKAVFDKYKFNTKYKISADFALTIELWGDPDFHFVYKDFTIANFNHLGVSGQKVDEPFQDDKADLIRKNFGTLTWLRYMYRKLKSGNNPRA